MQGLTSWISIHIMKGLVWKIYYLYIYIYSLKTEISERNLPS